MTVSLTKLEPTQQTQVGLTALWYMLVTAEVSDVVPPDSCIFVYRKSSDAGLGDTFAAVASASQMLTLPNAASPDLAYYRTDRAEFLCTSSATLAEVWASLQSDVQLLVQDWAKLSAGAVTGTTVILSPDVDPVESSTDIAAAASRTARAVFNEDFTKVLYFNAAGQQIGEQLLLRSV